MKFKKAAAMCLAAVMTISAASVSAFAVEGPTMRLQLKCQQDIQADTSGEIRQGVLPCGLSYKVVSMTTEEIEAMYSGISTRSYSWSKNVRVPIQDENGTNGAQLGNDLMITPHDIAVISVGGLPSTMSTINIGAAAVDGTWKDWIPGVEKNQKVILELAEGYDIDDYRVTVSTSEGKSVSARFVIETYCKTELSAE